MPPAITVSPHLVTPSRNYCTVPTSNSQRPSPSLVPACPRGKNSKQNGLCSKFSPLAGFWRFWFGGGDGGYDAPLTSQNCDRRHDPWLVYGSPSYSPARWSSWISPA